MKNITMLTLVISGILLFLSGYIAGLSGRAYNESVQQYYQELDNV